MFCFLLDTSLFFKITSPSRICSTFPFTMAFMPGFVLSLVLMMPLLGEPYVGSTELSLEDFFRFGVLFNTPAKDS